MSAPFDDPMFSVRQRHSGAIALLEVTIFVAGAAASGVIGSVAWEGTRRVVRSLGERLRPENGGPEEASQADKTWAIAESPEFKHDLRRVVGAVRAAHADAIQASIREHISIDQDIANTRRQLESERPRVSNERLEVLENRIARLEAEKAASEGWGEPPELPDWVDDVEFDEHLRMTRRSTGEHLGRYMGFQVARDGRSIIIYIEW